MYLIKSSLDGGAMSLSTRYGKDFVGTKYGLIGRKTVCSHNNKQMPAVIWLRIFDSTRFTSL